MTREKSSRESVSMRMPMPFWAVSGSSSVRTRETPSRVNSIRRECCSPGERVGSMQTSDSRVESSTVSPEESVPPPVVRRLTSGSPSMR